MLGDVMESKYIGIIVERQDRKIFFTDNKYYIRLKITDDTDIDSLIQQTLLKNLNTRFYKLRKIYNEIREYKNLNPFQEVNDIDSMYLVEICIYNENYVFLSKEEVYENLYNSPQKLFYEKYFLRYEKYKEFIQSVFISLVMIITSIVIINKVYIFNNQIYGMLVYILIIGIICSYLFIVPKIVVKLLDIIINEKIIKYSNLTSITIGIISLLIIVLIKI